MPSKQNQFKNNAFRDNEPRGSRPLGAGKRTGRLPIEKLPSFDLADGRLVKIIGLLFVILSLYFLVAFTSYLFTWQEDQSYVIDAHGGWGNLFKTVEELKLNGVKDPVVQNWLGKVGALLSHQFI